jgi:pyruvate,water dikinase
MKKPQASHVPCDDLHSRWILPLDQADDPKVCGNKASILARLSRMELPVPCGFVITNKTFEEFLNSQNLWQSIEECCRTIDLKRSESLQQASHGIRLLISRTALDATVRLALATPIKQLLNEGPVIVRSSAIGEDGAEASYAGQLDSFPNLYTIEQIEEAILCCWASYWSDRSLAYQHTRRVTLQGMGVLVQSQIASALSGVLFTRSPEAVSDLGDHMIAEFCIGHGGLLASGQINPGRLTISRADHTSRVVLSPEQEMGDQYDRFLTESNTTALGRIGTLLEQTLGTPQDIEWTIDRNGHLFVVQSRPISAFIRQSSLTRQILWSNANINENFPEPVSPLLYSIAKEGYSQYFRNLGTAFGITRQRLRTMEHYFQNIIGIHGGRMYYNLSNIHCVLRLMPFGARLGDCFSQFVGAVNPSSTGHSDKNHSGPMKGRLIKLLELGRIVFCLMWQYAFFTRRVESFEHTVTEYSDRTTSALLAGRTLSELGRDFHTFLEIRFHRWTNAALADAASMVCYGVLKESLQRAFPAANQDGLHNTLLKGLLNLVSSVPAVKLWDLAQVIKQDRELSRLFREQTSEEILESLRTHQRFLMFNSQFEAFLHEWGFRFSGELMLTVPNFQERPTALLEILKSYVGFKGESPLATLERQNADRNRETSRVLTDAPWITVIGIPVCPQRWLIDRVLKWTQHAVALRERARMKQALLYSRARQVALAIGDKLVVRGDLDYRDDVFFLTYQELDALLSGNSMFPYWHKEMVGQRKVWFQDLLDMTVPDTFELPEGEFLGHLNHKATTGIRTEICAALRGIGACGGQVMARATVLADVSESNRLVGGDVLVTKQTDPGWGLVFVLIKGLIMERGGMLSHGAIIAREYGIPTVVGVRDATRLIHSGRTVFVNGDQGVVSLMD